ncbi:MAG: hypothetical protein NTW52_01085 [Planctomycetota bacterium]|nr:hypothetical protein [Planctomycetota bacterium]
MNVPRSSHWLAESVDVRRVAKRNTPTRVASKWIQVVLRDGEASEGVEDLRGAGADQCNGEPAQRGDVPAVEQGLRIVGG